MLLPDKHIRISESVLGIAGLVLESLPAAISFDQLMAAVTKKQAEQKWPGEYSVESIALALCFLHSIDTVDVTDDGELIKCD